MNRYDEVLFALDRCAARAEAGPLTVTEAFEAFPRSSFCFLCMLLAGPFLLPISLPIAALGGVTFAVLGWQLLAGRTTPWIPRRIGDTALDGRIWRLLLAGLRRLLVLARGWTRPRWSLLVRGRLGQGLAGWTILLAGLLMVVPAGGLPFNNTLPALAIFCICLAELADDGVMVAVAAGWLVATVAYFAGLIVALTYLVSWAAKGIS